MKTVKIAETVKHNLSKVKNFQMPATVKMDKTVNSSETLKAAQIYQNVQSIKRRRNINTAKV